MAHHGRNAPLGECIMATVLLTGANRGLGLEFTRRYLGKRWGVVAIVRHTSPELEALGKHGRLRVICGDLGDDAFLDGLPEALAGARLDVLINNAGIMGTTSFAGSGRTMQCLADFSRDEWRQVFEANVFAPMHLSARLLPLLREGGTVVTLSSSMGSIASNQFAGWYAYRCSKSAVNMMMKCMSLELAERGIIAVALHPGWVRTDMGGSDADLSIEQSLDGMMRVIDGLQPEHSGRFLAWDGSELPY
jgi:NAD(P)-dependent dehydrogenase (short-subunit alcohol dehydrogenase family)